VSFVLVDVCGGYWYDLLLLLRAMDGWSTLFCDLTKNDPAFLWCVSVFELYVDACRFGMVL